MTPTTVRLRMPLVEALEMAGSPYSADYLRAYDRVTRLFAPHARKIGGMWLVPLCCVRFLGDEHANWWSGGPEWDAYGEMPDNVTEMVRR